MPTYHKMGFHPGSGIAVYHTGHKIPRWYMISELIWHLFEFQTIKCLIKYTDNPTYISTSYVKQWEANFPVITICPQWNTGYKEDILQASPSLSNNY